MPRPCLITFVISIRQGLTLVHFSAQRKHLLRDTSDGSSASVTKSEKWMSVNPATRATAIASHAFGPIFVRRIPSLAVMKT